MGISIMSTWIIRRPHYLAPIHWDHMPTEKYRDKFSPGKSKTDELFIVQG